MNISSDDRKYHALGMTILMRKYGRWQGEVLWLTGIDRDEMKNTKCDFRGRPGTNVMIASYLQKFEIEIMKI